jgi:hypothetical protein
VLPSLQRCLSSCLVPKAAWTPSISCS